MSNKLLLRIAFGLILFFLMGHTVGHFTWRTAADPAKQQVIKAMDGQAFEWGGASHTLGQNYDGYSWMLITTLVALALLVWRLSTATTTAPELVKQLCLPLALCLLGFGVFSFLFFFAVPAITCLLAGLALGWVALR